MEKTKRKKGLIILSVTIILLIFLAGAMIFYYFGKKYDFYNYSKAEIEIPGLKDGFVPQGLCALQTENGYLISGYMKDTSKPSRIYYVDEQGNSKYVLLDTLQTNLDNGHFCGIASRYDLVWLATDGYVFTIDLQSIVNATQGDVLTTIDIFETGIKTDFCYADDNMFYVGEFYRPGKYEVDETHYIKLSENETNHGIALCYNIDVTKQYGLSTTAPVKAISVPDQAQGFCITESGKMVVSTSYSLPDSKILVYDNPTLEESRINVNGYDLDLYVLSSNNLNKTIIAPCMSEGIDYKNGRVHILFESACAKYKYFTRVREKHVQSIEIN